MCALPAKKMPESKEPSERISELERELQAAGYMLEGIRDGVIFQDASGRVLKINKAMERILGAPAHQARGKTMQELIAGGGICCIFGRVGRHEKTFMVGGREYEIECSAVSGGRGEEAGLLTVFRDVTENHEADKAKADFMSMVTHDLKSPLTTILGYSALLLEGGMGDVTPEMRESIKAIERSGKKLLSTIEDFLVLSRLDAGAEARTAPVNIARLAEPLVASLWPEAARSGKVLELEAEPGMPSIQGDPRQLERVLANLLDNALKFTRAGGRIKVSVSQVDEELVAGKAGAAPPNRGPHVEVAVRDDGIGIPKEDLPYIFDRYWRGKLFGEHHGCGLGLAIVKCGVEAHRGLVKAESEGGGSAFYAWFPVTRK